MRAYLCVRYYKIITKEISVTYYIIYENFSKIFRIIIAKQNLWMNLADYRGSVWLFTIQVSTNGDNYRHVAFAMCLAIAMYIATGAFSIIQQFFSMISVFLLTLLGRAILLVGYITGDVPRRRRTVREGRELYTDSEEESPWMKYSWSQSISLKQNLSL